MFLEHFYLLYFIPQAKDFILELLVPCTQSHHQVVPLNVISRRNPHKA